MAFALGLPFPQETDTPTLVDSVRTLLGPRPQVKTIFGHAGNGAPNGLEIHKAALVAYRKKIVALMNILEGNVSVAANEPIARAPHRNVCGLRKPMAAERSARSPKETAA